MLPLSSRCPASFLLAAVDQFKMLIFHPLSLPFPRMAWEEGRPPDADIQTPDFIKQYLSKGVELSIYKSDSENFHPADKRVNVFDEQINPVTGSTLEKGHFLHRLRCGSLHLSAHVVQLRMRVDSKLDSFVTIQCLLLDFHPVSLRSLRPTNRAM